MKWASPLVCRGVLLALALTVVFSAVVVSVCVFVVFCFGHCLYFNQQVLNAL
jgi:hypothetical protein